MTIAQLVILPGFLLGVFMLVVLFMAARTMNAIVRARRSQAAMSAAWQKSYRELRDAADQVIVELETHPATYETFPDDVRRAVYAAHDSSRELERNK